MSTTYDIAPGRLAGAWTRMSEVDGSPMGRLHATRRFNGALEQEALCGYRIPERALKNRPFNFFDETHPKACAACAVASWQTS